MVLRIIIALIISFNVICALSVTNAQEREKATVTLVFINNSKSAFDDVLNEHITNFLHRKVDGLYKVINHQKYYKIMATLATSKSADKEIINVFANDEIDYAVYLELHPFNRKEQVALFRYGKKFSASMTVKIFDIYTKQTIYSNIITAKAANDQESVFLDDRVVSWVSIRSKDVGLTAVDKALFEAGEAISIHLPLQPNRKL